MFWLLLVSYNYYNGIYKSAMQILKFNIVVIRVTSLKVCTCSNIFIRKNIRPKFKANFDFSYKLKTPKLKQTCSILITQSKNPI